MMLAPRMAPYSYRIVINFPKRELCLRVREERERDRERKVNREGPVVVSNSLGVTKGLHDRIALQDLLLNAPALLGAVGELCQELEDQFGRFSFPCPRFSADDHRLGDIVIEQSLS
jgi:hypothetical protein